MKRKLSAGLTGVTLPIFVQDSSSTTGGGLAGLAYNTAGLVCEYRRQGQSGWTAVPLSAGTLGTSSGSATAGTLIADGGLTGAYELAAPDNVCASGAKWATVRLYGAANMLPVLIEVELDAVNYQSSTNFVASVPAVAGSVGSIVGVTFPTNFGALGITLAGKVSEVVLTDALTTYTGNVPQTGDGYARLGAPAGASIAADIATRSTYAGGAVASVTAPVTVGTNNDKTGYALVLAPPTAAQVAASVWDEPKAGHTSAATFGLYLDTMVSSRSTYAGGAVASVTAPVAVGTNNDKTGYALVLAPPTAAQVAASVWDEPKAGHTSAATFGLYLDSMVSSRSTYAGGPVALTPAGLDAVVIETGVNARQALSPILAACAGQASGLDLNNPVYQAGNNPATTRITARTDALGNRTAVTLTLPS